MKHLKLWLFIMIAILVLPVVALAQGEGEPFDISTFVIGLMAPAGAAMIISGWLSAKLTNASGVGALIQSWVVSVVLTMLAALVGLIPIAIGDVWSWVLLGLGNGVLANLLYKLGIWDALLNAMGGMTITQQANKKMNPDH